MIEISDTEVMGWEAAIRGMRNPLNSWDKSDSYYGCYMGYDELPYECEHCGGVCSAYKHKYVIGANDLDLMRRLATAGSDHAKYRRMITVYADVVAPLYWWKEYDTYKVGTVANSCSTMHKITDKEFTLEDFSHEHLGLEELDILESVIFSLNWNREKFLQAKKNGADGFTLKRYWWQMIQLLPSSYNQRRTIMVNYEVLANMYHSRHNHKLDEWREFCKWIESLPYSELITGGVKNDSRE